MEILAVKNLSFQYPTSKRAALSALSFSVQEGEFITVCGATGSGKSTLLRLLKRELAPVGTISGEILLDGEPLSALSARNAAEKIGYVMQHPEQQIVTDKVWHEMAFGLENLGVPQNEIRRRVAEMASYFGMENLFLHDTASLSGGQKQLLNLASVMVMHPRILLLDEPTAQLDPIAAADFIATLHKLQRELSLTVILIEHRLEEVMPLSDRLLVLENGKILTFDTPKNAVRALSGREDILLSMPSAVRLYHALEQNKDQDVPLDIREGRAFIRSHFQNTVKNLQEPEYQPKKEKAVSMEDVWFRYERGGEDILRGLSLTVYENEIFCLLGGNGAGKSTALGVLSGLKKPYGGNVRIFGKKIKDYKNGTLYKENLAYLPQDVQTLFLHNTVREELADADISSFPYDLSSLLDMHPYDLSGGERQLTALAKALASKPRLLLLDEPTKGLDAYAKAKIAEVLRTLKKNGVTIVMVTHDTEFAAEIADRTALFFRGEAVSVDTPKRFFSANRFYTTPVSRMTKGYYDMAITVSDAKSLCLANERRCIP